MADNSGIEWTDATWNPIVGCSVISPGCKHCYAMKLAGGRMQNHPSRQGLTRATKEGPVWTGEVKFIDQWLDQPLRWKRPRKIFVCAHSDLFHENVPDEWIDLVFGVMAATRHTFQVLTKRPARMLAYLRGIEAEAPSRLRHYIDVEMAESRAARQARGMEEPPPPTPELRAIFDRAIEAAKKRGLRDTRNGRDNLFTHHQYLWKGWPLPNVQLGVSAEDQPRADERIPLLQQTPAAVRWVSAEPLLGPVDLRRIRVHSLAEIDSLRPAQVGLPGMPWPTRLAPIDWVVVGGESGADARPMHPDWARSLRDQCAAAGVAFDFKQHGEFVEIDGIRCRGGHGNRDDRGPDVSWLTYDGKQLPLGAEGKIGGPSVWGTDVLIKRVGKKAAGRLLDGVEHNGVPGHG